MHVCTCVLMHACTYACMSTGKVGQATTAKGTVEVCLRVCVCAHAQVRMCMCVCEYVCIMYVIMQDVLVCTCARMYLCMHVLMHVCNICAQPEPPRSLTCSSDSQKSASSESSSSSSSPCARLCACLTGHVCVRARVPVCVRVSGRARVRVCVPRLCVFHRSLGCRPNFVHIMMCSEHRYRHTA